MPEVLGEVPGKIPIASDHPIPGASDNHRDIELGMESAGIE
tara:strand:+ start:4944 stop:5066 length:123 start_codon:yes stop_codon:yes gene_type:complete